MASGWPQAAAAGTGAARALIQWTVSVAGCPATLSAINTPIYCLRFTNLDHSPRTAKGQGLPIYGSRESRIRDRQRFADVGNAV